MGSDGTSLNKDHPDFVEEGWEKFDRRCSDHSNCFAETTDQLQTDGKYLSFYSS